LNRKLIALNVMLIAVVGYAFWHLRSAWQAEKSRETAELSKPVKPQPPPPFSPLATAPPVVPAGYADIAQKTLFDRSRNPTVVVETPPPPPPKPMPALPVYHGQMNIGSGIIAIFSQMPTSAHQAIHPGEFIGQFKLVDVNTEEITFEWDGKEVRKKVDELLDRTGAAQGAPQAAPQVASARTEQPAPAPAQAEAKTPIGPGEETANGTRTCNPKDSLPPGAVQDGYRKVVTPTPFGDMCRWDPIGR